METIDQATSKKAKLQEAAQVAAPNNSGLIRYFYA